MEFDLTMLYLSVVVVPNLKLYHMPFIWINIIIIIMLVPIIIDDGTVIYFNNPNLWASFAADTFALTGQAENKQIAEM